MFLSNVIVAPSVSVTTVHLTLAIVGVVIVGLVRVLLVSVSVVALPTSVSVEVGSVSVPVFTIVLITGAVRVLSVSVSVHDRVAKSQSVFAALNCAVVQVIPTIDVWSPLFVPVNQRSVFNVASVCDSIEPLPAVFRYITVDVATSATLANGSFQVT